MIVRFFSLKHELSKKETFSREDVANMINSCRIHSDDLKYIRNGRYAVLVSKERGKGFSSIDDIDAHDYYLINFLFKNNLIDEDGRVRVPEGSNILDEYLKNRFEWFESDADCLKGLYACHIRWVELADDYIIGVWDDVEYLRIV